MIHSIQLHIRLRSIIYLILLIFLPAQILAQGILDSSSDTDDLFDKFQEDRFKDITDQEVIKKKFQDKKQRYNSLMNKKTPVFFKADHQEIIEHKHLFILTGNVSIWKDDFKVISDKVIIDRFSGEITATDNVEVHFGKDILTGDKLFYNFDTGTGWISNARGVVEPALFIEGTLLEKLPDHPKTTEGQYALHDGFITACSGQPPDWRIKYKYALIRIENYAFMNKASFWASRVPIFYSPYMFYPTKTKRATGFLIPSLSWSSRKGVIVSDEFFWVINDTMDTTFGLTYYSEIGTMEEFEWRNAFSQYSRGELQIEHLKERKSPSEDRNPQERWSGKYDQTYIFPLEIRGTANLNFRSDQYFDQDYGVELEQEADRYMESRLSLTKNWNMSHLTLDGIYEKDFDKYHDETFQHSPRLTFNSGSQTLLSIFKGLFTIKSEYLQKEGLFSALYDTENGNLTIDDWIERDCFRSDVYAELRLPVKEVAWLSFTPWISIRETWWDNKKNYDPDYIDGSWATYAEETNFPENTTFAGIHESNDWLRREMYGYGFDWSGPRFYRIFPLLGYDRITKIKHIIEPRIEYRMTPEVNQEKIIQFDTEDWREPGQTITYSITNRFLAKIKPKKSGENAAGKKSDDSSTTMTSSADEENTDSTNEKQGTPDAKVEDNNGNSDADPGKSDSDSADQDATSGKPFIDPGTIKEFGYFTISQSYDLWKADEWDTREPLEEGEDERNQYPLGNIRFEATINPFADIYLSARMEYDPFYDSFSHGYLYGYYKSTLWKSGVRWDYAKNFMYPLSDMHSIALEGAGFVNENWGIASWVKYDFELQYFPYVNLDLTYTSQCWAITFHTYYTKIREGQGTETYPFEDTDEIQFGLSVTLKNLDSVGPKKLGKFWWGNE